MPNNLLALLDQFHRMSWRQRYYWFRNRVVLNNLHKRTYIGLKYIDKESDPYREHLDEISTNLDKLKGIFAPPNMLAYPQNASSVESRYIISLKQEVLSCVDKNEALKTLKNKWLLRERTEELNCYHRFHLFSRYLLGSRLFPKDLYSAISSWSAKPLALPKWTFDPYNCAVRIINWIEILVNTQTKKLPGRDHLCKTLRSLFDHANYLHSKIEYELGGNHVIVELFSLWLVYTVLNVGNSANSRLNLIKRLLSEEYNRQFCEGYFHQEKCTHYHMQCTIAGLLWLKAMDVFHQDYDKILKTILKRAYDNIFRFQINESYLPTLGNKCYSLFTESTCADMKLLHTLIGDFGSIKSRKTGPQDIHNIGGQYLIARKDKLKIIVGIGNIGCKRNPGHGHSDLLSYIFSYDRMPIVIDPGIDSYDTEYCMIRYKKSLFHNTLTVDGKDQALLLGNFRWAFLPKVGDCEFHLNKDSLYLQSSYRTSKRCGNFKHTRKFILRNKSVAVTDIVDTKGTHNLALNMILHHDIAVETYPAKVILNHRKRDISFLVSISDMPFIEVTDIELFPDYGAPVPSKKVQFTYDDTLCPKVIETYIELIN